MAKFLEEVGMIPTIPEGGYFMVADFFNLSKFVTTIEFTSTECDYCSLTFCLMSFGENCRFERDKN